MSTTTPPVGAGVASSTVASALRNGRSWFGEMVKLKSFVVFTVSVRVTVILPRIAEIVTGVSSVTDRVVIGKVPICSPAGMVIELGTTAAAVLDDRVRTTRPPAGAGLPMSMVPTEF